jgi:hypothetical protein
LPPLSESLAFCELFSQVAWPALDGISLQCHLVEDEDIEKENNPTIHLSTKNCDSWLN